MRRGSQQELQIPKLTEHSIEKMQDLRDWIKESGTSSAPWVARVRLEVPGQGRGSWQATSSEAFLSLPLEAFILVSAGSLHPAVEDKTVQMLSIPDPTDGYDDTDLDNPRLWAVFHVLLEYLDVLPGKTIAWVPDNGKPIIFYKRGVKWRNHYIDYMK